MEELCLVTNCQTDLFQFLCKIMCFRHRQNCCLSDTFISHRCKINTDCQCTKCLVRTDIAGSFFSPDVLLSCLKCQYITSLSVMIDRLTNNSSRELSHHRFLTCHKSKIRSAESERKSERLSFSDCHVCPVFCRSLDYSQRNRIHSHHIFGSCLMCDLADLFCVFQITVIVRMLDIYAGCLRINMFF